jgi:drug/metabolite transporter (DMT)-like permease
MDFVLVAMFWGTSFLFTRLTVVEFGALPSAGMRVLLAALVLLAILASKGLLPVLRQHWRLTFTVGIMNSGLPFVAFAWALLHLTTGLTSILNATVPLFGAVVAWIWLGDKPSRSRMWGLAIGFLGVALLAWNKAAFKPGPDGTVSASGWAVLALLAACALYGVGACFAKVYLSKVPPLVIATGSQCGALLLLGLPMLWFWPTAWPSVQAWAAMGMSGVFSTALAYILYFRLIERVGPAKAMTVTFMIPLFAVVAGVIFLGEGVTLWMLGCGLVIVCGTLLATGLVRFK